MRPLIRLLVCVTPPILAEISEAPWYGNPSIDSKILNCCCSFQEVILLKSPDSSTKFLIRQLTSERSVKPMSGSTKLYKVHICYQNLSGSIKSSQQVHNEMKTSKNSYYLVYAYILRIFKIKVCEFSINVKSKFHSNIQKQNFHKSNAGSTGNHTYKYW